MSRIVYVGGFGDGRTTSDRIGNALGAYFEDPRPFTFSDWVNNPEEVERAAYRSVLAGRSAGAMALRGAAPSEAYLFNAPLPRKASRLVVRAAYKQIRLLTPGIGIHSVEDAEEVLRYSGSATAELAAHPIANFGQIAEIARFDALNVALDAKREGIPTELIWTDKDVFFAPNEDDHAFAAAYKLPVRIVPGEHDELAIHPEKFLHAVFG